MSETDSLSGLNDKELDEDSTSDEDDHNDDNSMMEAEFNVSEPVYVRLQACTSHSCSLYTNIS